MSNIYIWHLHIWRVYNTTVKSVDDYALLKRRGDCRRMEIGQGVIELLQSERMKDL